MIWYLSHINILFVGFSIAEENYSFNLKKNYQALEGQFILHKFLSLVAIQYLMMPFGFYWKKNQSFNRNILINFTG